MQTFYRICIKDFQIQDSTGNIFQLERGKEYLTSREMENQVTVLSNYWVKVPSNLFAGEVQFTS